jgi:hypothetical protein
MNSQLNIKKPQQGENFWIQMSREYNFFFRPGEINPFDLNACTVAVRRKDIAERLINIFTSNVMDLSGSLYLLDQIVSFVNAFTFPLCGIFYPMPDHREHPAPGGNERMPSGNQMLEKSLKRIAKSEQQVKALKEIIQLIADNNLSYAEIRGAVWETALMLMHMSLEVKWIKD